MFVTSYIILMFSLWHSAEYRANPYYFIDRSSGPDRCTIIIEENGHIPAHYQAWPYSEGHGILGMYGCPEEGVDPCDCAMDDLISAWEDNLQNEWGDDV